MSEKDYRLYTIKCGDSKLYFTGVTSSSNNMMYWLYRQYVKDNNKYTELGESIKKYGMKKHVYSVFRKFSGSDAKENADKLNFKLQNKLKEKELLMNSVIINPERVVCAGCGYRIRKVFMEKHLEYCKSNVNKELDDIMTTESDEEYLENVISSGMEEAKIGSREMNQSECLFRE